MPTSVEVTVDHRRLALSNLEKVLYPEDREGAGAGRGTGAVTKADVIDYYRRVSPVLLPHLARRPPTLVRAPDGAAGEVFFEKRCPPHHPEWIETAEVGRYGRHSGYEGCLVDDLPALVWVANLAALELHTHQATVDDPEHPTAVVVDLDPGPPAGPLECARVALELHDVLDRLGLEAVVKTSGGKGLHLGIPVRGSDASASQTKDFALALGRLLESRSPERVTTNMAKQQRPGKVFVDWSQNDRFKTTIAPYSLRVARPTPSTPLSWDELDDASSPDDLVFDTAEVLARVERHGDLYAGNLTTEQELPVLGGAA